jgi:hypothetical protein
MSISSLYGSGSASADWFSATSRRTSGDTTGNSQTAAGGETASATTARGATDSTAATPGITQLSPAEEQEVAELKATDRKVRTHEQAHLAAAGGLATSGASFSYQQGPDGQRYAIGGEVSIDTSKGSTPQETISRAGRIEAAALAPADPSAQDRRVAATAEQMKAQAEAQLRAEQLAAQKSSQGGTTSSSSSTTAYSETASAGNSTQSVGGLVNTYA